MRTEQFPDGRQITGDSGCGLIVNDANSLDGMRPVSFQLRCQGIKIGTSPPVALYDINPEVEALLLIDPEEAELADEERDDPITRRESVGKGTFPGTST